MKKYILTIPAILALGLTMGAANANVDSASATATQPNALVTQNVILARSSYLSQMRASCPKIRAKVDKMLVDEAWLLPATDSRSIDYELVKKRLKSYKERLLRLEANQGDRLIKRPKLIKILKRRIGILKLILRLSPTLITCKRLGY